MSERPAISRRELLRGRFLAGFLGGVTESLEPPAPVPASEPSARRSGPFRGTMHLLRPPGAVDEPSFLAGCTKCDACLEACPHDAILRAPARYREAAGTPMIDPVSAPCVLCDDRPCARACEAGVLRLDLPAQMGTARIDTQTCLAHQGTFCSVCSEQCPVEGAIAVEQGRPRIVAERCVGCGVCLHVCPAPGNAVLILPERDRPPAPPDPVAEGAPETRFPPLRTAELSMEEAADVFRDLERCAEVESVSVKGGAEQMTSETPYRLDEAIEFLQAGAVRGVQVRYRFEDASWCDTFLRLPRGVRLVRVRHEFEE